MVKGCYFGCGAEDVEPGAEFFDFVDEGGVIENLGLVGGSITGNWRMCGLVGYNFGGEIRRCYSSATVVGNGSVVGGLVGYHTLATGLISESDATGSVTAVGDFVGGLAGNVASGAHTESSFATGGGVTAGIDFGLAMLAQTHGEDFAKTMQLGLEYAPAPPFDVGTPDKAPQELVDRVMGLFAEGE